MPLHQKKGNKTVASFSLGQLSADFFPGPLQKERKTKTNIRAFPRKSPFATLHVRLHLVRANSFSFSRTSAKSLFRFQARAQNARISRAKAKVRPRARPRRCPLSFCVQVVRGAAESIQFCATLSERNVPYSLPVTRKLAYGGVPVLDHRHAASPTAVYNYLHEQHSRVSGMPTWVARVLRTSESPFLRLEEACRQAPSLSLSRLLSLPW